MSRPPQHLHRNQQESFEVLNGQVTVRTGCEQHALSSGDRIAVSPAARPSSRSPRQAGGGTCICRPARYPAAALFTALSPLARARGYRTSYQRFTEA
jgi:hypothetical protein